MIAVTPSHSYSSARRLCRRVTLSAILLTAGAVLLAACQRSQGPGRAASGGATASTAHPFAHPFSPKVELQQLGPYVQSLSAAPYALPDDVDNDLVAAVKTFYQRRQMQPAWFADGRPRPEASGVLDFLAKLDDEGLEPADYRVEQLRAGLDAVSHGKPGVRPEDVEVGLTWAALLAASDLYYGRVTPQKVEARWLVHRERTDLPAVLAEGLAGGKVGDRLRALDPAHPQFQGLLEAFRRYRQFARNGGWPVVPKGPVLTVGDKADAARLRALAQRLQAEGFLAAVPPELQNPAPGTKLAYTQPLADAVKAFQATRTVERDGSLGPETQEELNVPVVNRLRQLELNLERWRWLPDDFGPRAVLVNLPGYTLDVEESHRIVMSMRTVVGQEGWETPIFSDRIRFLVLNPDWTVPPGIYKKELGPKLAADPGYLAEHDMEVVNDGGATTVRQRPGPENPLGKVKFMFPNKYNIYLHDTNQHELFGKADRDDSHGCIRIEKPFELADYLLRDDPKWGGGKLEAAIASGDKEQVPLRTPVPVYLLYFTAAVRSDGSLQFYEDIYDIDRAQSQAWAELTSRRPGGAAPAAEKEAVQQQAPGEAAYVGPPRHTHGAEAWARQRAGALQQLQAKPGQ
jgi:murein L,D-transpeptidase YcbB/YkuD